jgi:hypothetical protein
MAFINGAATVDREFLSVLEEKYNVLDVIMLKHYDQDFERLREHLLSLRKQVFDPRDRIIVVQFDTDYYIHNQYGINLINLFTTWQAVDIPLSVMLFYTCTFGISQEINQLCQHSHANDRPTVIETFFNETNYWPERHVAVDVAVDDIEYHGLALMGSNRSHRFALYNHLQHLTDCLVMTLRGRK